MSIKCGIKTDFLSLSLSPSLKKNWIFSLRGIEPAVWILIVFLKGGEGWREGWGKQGHGKDKDWVVFLAVAVTWRGGEQ